LKDVIVPEPKDTIALALEESCSSRVGQGVNMLASVGFDN